MNRLHISGALLLGAAFALPGISHAQPELVEVPLAPLRNVIQIGPDSQTAQILLRNTPSALMAYWLDPSHQPRPIQLKLSEANAGVWAFNRDELPRQPGNGNGPRDLKLPPDVEIMGSVGPQNILLIKGTTAGIQALQKLVTEIDVRLGQIEIEAQLIEIAPAKLASLPLVFRDTAEGEEKNLITYGMGDFFARAAFTAPISDIGPLTQN